MEQTDLAFRFEDKRILGELLENASALLKDSDAAEEKELVREFLRSVSDVLTFSMLGKSGVGKTSLMEAIFGNITGSELTPTVNLQEYRQGIEELERQVDYTMTRHFRMTESLEGLAVCDTQGCDRWEGTELATAGRNYLMKSDVILVVFDVDSVKNYAVWDILEGMRVERAVFILTKADLADAEALNRAETRIRQYMLEAGIDAPIFRVSSVWERERSGIAELCDYIRQDIIGPNPILTKYTENVMKIKGVLEEVGRSFELRKKQYEADVAVLQKINMSIDHFCINSDERVDRLIDDLRREIAEEIDDYEKEIIRRLDPMQVKERFQQGKTEFMEWIDFVNEGYRKRMEERVNSKTQNAVRLYVSELEDVFEEATGYFRKRKTLLSLEDKFYGTLAVTKKTMVDQASHELKETCGYYRTLREASEELFAQIWYAREEYDRKMRKGEIEAGVKAVVTMGGGVVGAFVTNGIISGVAAGAAAGTSAAAGTASAAGIAGTLGTVASAASVAVPLLIVVGSIYAGIKFYGMAKEMSEAKNSAEMEQAVAKSIEQFKREVAQIKAQMTEQIEGTIRGIFKRELDGADKTFAEFRMTVNIDSRNIPLLEERMEKVEILMTRIGELERAKRLE